MNNKLLQVCRAFRVEGELQSYEEIKVGNVNRTYKVNFIRPDGTPKAYMMQAVNTYVFKNPVQVMENIDNVTEYIRKKDPNKKSLHFYHTEDRKNYVFDENGFWRMFNYVPSVTYNTCTDLDVVRNAGEAFGDFQTSLSDFDASQLYVTIPDFHNTKKRFEKLIEDISADPLGKVSEVKAEIDYLLSYYTTAKTKGIESFEVEA